ncbi:VOC family protein [Sphingobacterium paludis]|uniref:VOC domain-containing protein n=1 Tax=Sphingobacterium paludis TaxID=1476465 RepID=A0A4R7CW79_9SPHI|nr:hypothetical protein [Sphingobacterium paludis]TDS11921.1 hypothetical protein B0I21_107273 [Sphingobacterium paludis]
MEINFRGGLNMAMKISPANYEQTVTFYRDILLFDVEEIPITHPTVLRSHRLHFGPNTLWLDCVEDVAHPQIWLELHTEDVERAAAYLETNDVKTCDEIEEISPSMHWIKDPSGNVLLVKKQ